MNTAESNPFRLYRDPARGWLAGVCAGLADYLGTSPGVLRGVVSLGVLFFTVPTVVAYVVLALVLPQKPPRLFADAEEEDFWRDVTTAPVEAVATLRRRFRDYERRIRRMEALVTSDELELRRGFRDMGR